MIDEYLIKSLKRVHDEAERALTEENYSVNQSIVSRFNEVLSEFKEEYPENERIRNIEAIESVDVHVTLRNVDAMNTIQDAKLQSLKIADALDLDTEDFQELSGRGGFPFIKINQQQAQGQQQHQQVTVEKIIEDIGNMTAAEEDKEELRNLVQEYERELEEGADPSRLRQIVQKAKEYSDDVALKLIMLATQRGFNILTGT
ncbi:MAG: hypothetical protein U5J64_06930 [Halobacteriales archaeon]|nr:hypothetical protein [Halobacteriales archaeon]